MRRLLVLGCVLTLGCAGSSLAPEAGSPSLDLIAGTIAKAPVEAGPSECVALYARIDGTLSQIRPESHTWLDAPVHMAEARRLRALEARAEALGCELPRS